MMQGRTFRFESLLRLRSAREEACRRAVGARVQKILRMRQKRSELVQQLREQTDGLRQGLVEPCADLESLRMSRHWIARLRLRILEAESTIAGEQSILAQERSSLVEARKQRRVLESLKERQRAAWMDLEARREQRATDEVNAARAARLRLTREEFGW